MKDTYKNAVKKRWSQERVLKGGGRIIGLGGIDIEDYVKIAKKAGFKDITIYEKNKQVFLNQLLKLPQGIKLIYGDIREDLEENAFYDLDFCSSILDLSKDKLQKISKLKRFALTLTIRPVGLKRTIEIFRQYSQAPYIYYRDTSPMITFYKH